MENNLSKAIKFPVRYDEGSHWLIDANEVPIGSINIKEVGHALADWINGLDGRGNLQEGNSFDSLVDDLISGKISIQQIDIAVMTWIRQNKNLEGVQDLLAHPEGGGLIRRLFRQIRETIGSMELAHRRGEQPVEATDRQVKSAEEIMLKHGLFDYAQATTIAKRAFAAGVEYAQQYK